MQMLDDRPAALAPLRVRELDIATERAWDELVERCPDATFFHRAGWKRVIEQSFGHECPYLYAEQAGRIVGVLPLVHVKSALFGRALISTGFCVYGGPAALTPEARRALSAKASDLADRLGVDYLEYRSRTPHEEGWQQKSEVYATFRKSITGDPEKDLKAIPRKQRAMVRKGIANGLVSEVDPDVERLHRIYAESVRNLGTPVFPKRYFRDLRETFADACDVVTIVHGGTAVSGVMNFYFRDEVLPYYGGGRSMARTLAANDFMYWEVIRRAGERGCRLFDFGRSKCGTGSFDFKKNWGFVPEPLHYEYRLGSRGSLPDLSPLNPKYRLFIAAWKKLPLPIANFLGPPIVRGLG